GGDAQDADAGSTARETDSADAGSSGAASSWQVGGGVAGEAAWGMFPSAALAPSLFLEVASTSERPFAPLFRLSAEGAAASGYQNGASSTRFRWASGALEACPFRVAANTRWVIVPCLFGEAGVLDGRTEGLDNLDPKTRPWLAGGAKARAV